MAADPIAPKELAALLARLAAALDEPPDDDDRQALQDEIADAIAALTAE